MMAKAPTVYDVAELAGVSIATVSRVLRSPGVVKESTSVRVMDAVRELGYLPSGSARGLAARRTNVIGLFLPGHDAIDRTDSSPLPAEDGVRFVIDHGESPAESRDLYFDEVLRGVEVEAWSRGFALMIGVGRGSSREVMAGNVASLVDGLAVLSRTVPDELLTQLARRMPVVMLAGPRGDDRLDHVGVDNAGGMYALTRHVLVGHGIRDLVYVTGPDDSPDSAERRAGFDRALAEAGVQARVLPGDFLREGGRAAAERLAADPPRAIVCANDQTAIGVLEVLERHGVAVPDRTMVTGFDGIAAGRTTRPRLTTVRQPMAELGRVAVQAITARLADPLMPPQTFVLPVEIVLRESCPPVG